MSIPPFDLALRRRIPPDSGFACLMAEYACPGRCVRTAVQGFFPAWARSMPGRKDRRALHSAAELERDARLFQARQACARKIMPEKNAGRNAMRRRNESFYQKNGRKQGFCCAKFFAIAFARRLMYCIMVAGGT